MVTDEMLKRAIEAYAKDTGAEDWQIEGWINSAIRAALEAALSAAEPVCCGKPVHEGSPEAYTLECCGKFVQSAPSVAVKALQMADETFRDLGWHDKYEATTAALAALSAQVQDVAGLENNPVTLRWWCQQLLDIIENYDISHDSCDEEIALINDIRSSVDPAAPAKQEGGESNPVHNQSVENGESGDE